MSWLTTKDSSAASLNGLLGNRPELLVGYQQFYQRFWDDQLVPRRLLELARLRIAAIHNCAPQWQLRDPEVQLTTQELLALQQGSFGDFSFLEQNLLNLAELMPFGHHQITDEQVAELVTELGQPAVVSLLTALAFFDVNSRLNLVFDIQPETSPGGATVSQTL